MSLARLAVYNKAGVDLKAKIADTRFTWGDALLQRKTGTYAKPNPEQMENIIKQARAINNIYDLLGGFEITSWLRTPDYNKAIGGAPHSAHLDGLATDFVPKCLTVKDAKDKIKKFGGYPGGGEENSTNWCHLDLKHTGWFIA